MTPKMQAFADALLAGKTGSDAYRLAYPDSKANPRVVSVKAARLSRHPEIMAVIAKERAKTANRAAWSREEMITTLREIAEAKDSPKSARTGAIAQASRMLGFDAPQKVEGVNGGAPIVVQWLKS
jgi:hypothetical protein